MASLVSFSLGLTAKSRENVEWRQPHNRGNSRFFLLHNSLNHNQGAEKNSEFTLITEFQVRFV